MAPGKITAEQVADMAGHFLTCGQCGGDAPELAADLTERLPAEELVDAIAAAHNPRWLAIVARAATAAP